MLSVETLSRICEDAAIVFEQSTNGLPQEETLRSAEFLRIKKKVLPEYPNLDDARILRFVLKEYSERLRHA